MRVAPPGTKRQLPAIVIVDTRTRDYPYRTVIDDIPLQRISMSVVGSYKSVYKKTAGNMDALWNGRAHTVSCGKGIIRV